VKRFAVLMAMFVVLVGSIFGQQAPQIAFRYLDDYIAAKEEKSAFDTAGVIRIAVGSAMMAGSAVAWYFGDDISARLAADGQPWDSTAKSTTAGSMAVGGLLSIGTGVGLLFVPEPDYRSRYGYIYGEKDPVLQEDFAAEALERMSDKGRKKRLVRGWIDLAVPMFTVGVQVTSNLTDGRLWHTDVFSVSFSQILQIAKGISRVFFQTSEGETLFQEYKADESAVSIAPAR
jgi:hypothetical protein